MRFIKAMALGVCLVFAGGCVQGVSSDRLDEAEKRIIRKFVDVDLERTIELRRLVSALNQQIERNRIEIKAKIDALGETE